MVSEESPPGGRGSRPARILLPPALLMAAAAAGAVAAVAPPARLAVGLIGALCTVLVLAVAAEAVRRGHHTRQVREHFTERLEFLERRLAGHDEETVRLSSRLIPDAVFRLKQGESPDEVIRAVVDEDPAHRDLPRPQRLLLRSVLETVDEEEARREISQRAFVNIARRVQAIVHQQAAELRGMEEDYGRSPEVFDDLLRIDHGTALIGRLADSIAVLGGARPGRQWPRPVPLFSVLRGAMSRILEYQRIELHSIVKVAVKGSAVEPLIHACAELLDNATRYSPPQTKVHVTAVEVQSGIAIEIEDGGVSLSEEARARAERILSAPEAGSEIQDLGETPRLGLAVVGRLSRMYDLRVSLRQSAYGGVRAVLVAPHDMLTTGPAPGLAHGIGASAVPRIDEDGTLVTAVATKKRRPTGPVPSPVLPPQRTAEPPAPQRAASAPAEDEAPVVTEWTAMGLPQRRSRVKTPLSQRIAEARAEEAARQAAESASASAASVTERMAPGGPRQNAPDPGPEPGLWVEAFMEGVHGGDRGAGTDQAGEPRAAADAGRLPEAAPLPGAAPGAEPPPADGSGSWTRSGPGAGSSAVAARPAGGSGRPPARTDSDDVVDEGDPK
ncbi:ATP-binding protein [Streptomyces sp. TS71-3]|uniref:ATP-binding protein n=1 Tax=Streptomyces sp. TS71-3 TaxID=2733862 RepID=UPI001AFCF9E3|nr:ATP-binding protein [Streptomyces sp. TS71-3]GHJ38764.1 ATPase [Streptomyces sp. TS71-3]